MEAYARARECNGQADPIFGELRKLPDAAFLALGRDLVRTARRSAWRSRMAWRSASVSRVLRLVCRAARDGFVGREKVRGGWVVRVRDGGGVVTGAVITLPPVRRLEDFLVPLDIAIVRPDLIDVDLLRRLLSLASDSAAATKEDA